MAELGSVILLICALILAPLLIGLINRAKAFVAGRRGPPLLQPYWDVAKCLRRGAVYGDVTSWVFRLGPVVNLAALVAGVAITPFGGVGSVLSFSGDLVVLAGLFALGRFVTVLAALDTGSSFEGMGASREVHFAALAEPALLLALATLSRVTGSFSLTTIYGAITASAWIGALPALALVAMTLLVLNLVENARVPVDDPNTHLELTMIHEVMVLDHSGPDLAFIQYAAALKLWIFGHALGLLTCFALLGTSRIGACIRWLSVQGILFGMVPIIMHDEGLTLRVILLAGGNIALKGIIFPWLLLRLRARANYNREVEPFIGFVASILFGILALALSVWLALELKPALRQAPFLMLESSIFLIFIGLFLIISRRKALMQVIGYLVLENGIFVFGFITAVRTPVLVELGVLLDAFVAVFVMGIAIFHINREFGSMDVDQLTALKG